MNILYYNIDFKIYLQLNIYIFVNCFKVLCNISFDEDGRNRWPKHVAGHAVCTIINLQIIFALVGRMSHNEQSFQIVSYLEGC